MPQSAAIFDQIKGLLGSINADEATKEIARLDAEIEAMQAEQTKWRSLLGLIQQLGTGNGAAVVVDTDAKPTMRQAIRRVLEDREPGTSMKLKQIGDTIIQRDWMEDVKKDWHRLQMMASTMFKQNQLERPKMGYYRLPLKDSDGAPDGENPEGQGVLEKPPAMGAG